MDETKRHFDLKDLKAREEDARFVNKRGHVLTGANHKSVVDQLIEEAQERGDFDDLEGAGKPLDLDENRFAGDMQMAHKMLKDNGFTLPWIEDRKRVQEEIDALRAKIQHQWTLFGPQVIAMARGGQLPMAERRWTALTSQWHTSIDLLNRRIQDVNNSIPVRRLAIIKLGIGAELTRVGIGDSLSSTLESLNEEA